MTASDVAAICGENPYETPDGVMRKKMYRIVMPDNENTLHGRKYEPVAINIVSGMTMDGSKVKQVYYIKFVKHKKYRWLGGTVDGLVELEDGRVFVLEVKCPKKRRIINGIMPAYYMPQVQTYMFVTRFMACAFVQYKPQMGLRGKEKIDVTLVLRDEWYMPIRLPILKEFRDRMVLWRYIQEQRSACAVSMLQDRWLTSMEKQGRRSAPNHRCVLNSERARRGMHMVNLVLMMSMCKKRAKMLHERFNMESRKNDTFYVTMYDELKLCSRPMKLCECMMGSIVCMVEIDAEYVPYDNRSYVQQRRKGYVTLNKMTDDNTKCIVVCE
ncbi:MAG: YqaJ viral recombinase family protein [Methylococcales bacterium]|nr:YqaJ viral recombinase family protein [Methylococcales bacterium]